MIRKISKFWKEHVNLRLVICFLLAIWICFGILVLMPNYQDQDILSLSIALSIILGFIFGYLVWSLTITRDVIMEMKSKYK
ncbi:MAG: hypothetical protein OH319_00060 [Candidatus Parvarchaeota archaeon]|nr:hypothetical protein [Candidatus Jingweiarchaeum tengchongense]MCW1310868.1 hypothetical protein [Candidatus Jingweiarchaeum tengchongense]